MMSQYNDTSAGSITSLKKLEETPQGKLDRWAMEITAAEKAQEKWHKQSTQVVQRFVDERDAVNSGMKWFNIFNTNVQIMQASLYSQVPKIDVSRAHSAQADDIARVAALLVERAVTCDMDDFNAMMKHAIEDRLVPGAGMAWLRLEVETEEGEDGLETINYQEVEIDYVFWKDILWSPCKVWEERRWVARIVLMTSDALVKRFGEEKAKTIPLDYAPKVNDQTAIKTEDTVLKRARVYEIWDKDAKQVIWYAKGCAELLDVKDDPLKLDDFEPFPAPMVANTTTTNFQPKADYAMLQDQYSELDTLNNRISLLTIACKVVGVYDASATGIQRMLTEGFDNIMIPVDNWAMFAEKGSTKGAMDFLPLDMVVTALKTLVDVRESVKQQIYELTGISDIIRGDTKASETLGAQNLKAQFASVRIKKLQDEMVLFGQKILQIKAELICRYFTPEQILGSANAEYIEESDKQYLVPALELIKGNWEKFEWRVAIQADSMALIDWERKKTERSEFMTAVATFLQSASTVGQGAPELIPLMLELLKFGVAGFKVSKEVEGIFDKYIGEFTKGLEEQKANPQPDPEAEKMQTELQMQGQQHQMDMQKQQSEIQGKQVEAQTKMQVAQTEAQLKMQQMQQELQFKQQEHAMKMQQMEQEHQFKMTMMVEQGRVQQQVAIQSADVSTELAHVKAESDMQIAQTKASQEPETAAEKGN